MRPLYLALLCGLFAMPAAADPAPATDTQTPPAAATPATPPAAATTTTAPAGTTAAVPAAPTAAAPAAPATDPNKVDENSASYVEGYSDGCASANLRYAHEAHVKPGRDPKLYDSDNDYHQGWDHGYRKCEDKASSGALPVMGNSIIM